MRGFSDEEREEIRNRLKEEGLILFSTYGPRKTTIDDLTDRVGIAHSTFYLFFDSKGELIEEIVHEQRVAFMERVEDELSDSADAQSGLETLFRLHAAWLEENQFLQQVFFTQRLEDAIGSLPPEVVEENREELIAELITYVEAMYECEGRVLRDVAPMEVIGLLSTNAFLVSNRSLFEEYDPAFYDGLKDTMISALARGLTMDPDADS